MTRTLELPAENATTVAFIEVIADLRRKIALKSGDVMALRGEQQRCRKSVKKYASAFAVLLLDYPTSPSTVLVREMVGQKLDDASKDLERVCEDLRIARVYLAEYRVALQVVQEMAC